MDFNTLYQITVTDKTIYICENIIDNKYIMVEDGRVTIQEYKDCKMIRREALFFNIELMQHIQVLVDLGIEFEKIRIRKTD